MDLTAAGIFAGALLGVAFQEVSDAIKRINVRNSTIMVRLDSLRQKLEVLSLRFIAFDELCPDFGLQTETLRLRELLEKAKALVLDCEELHWWQLRLTHNCSKRLEILNASFADFLTVDLQVAQLRHILDNAARVVELNQKLDRMYVQVAYVPPTNGGGDNYGNVRHINERSGLRTGVRYERMGF